jgi:peroxiredoxin
MEQNPSSSRLPRTEVSGGPGADTPAAPASTGDRLSLDRFLGRVPVAVCFTGSVDSPVSREVVRGFDDHLADFGRSRVQALVVVPDDASAVDRARAEVPGNTPVLADEDGAWRERFGVLRDEKTVTTVLIGLDGAVVDVLVGGAGGVHAEDVLELVSLSSLDEGARR